LTHLWKLIGWRRLVVTGLCLAAWRGLEQIAVTGLSPGLVDARLQGYGGVSPSPLIHAIGDAVPFASLSVVALGLGPYINALIVMMLVPLISKRVREMGKSPEGRVRLTRWALALTVVMTLGQAYGWIGLLQTGSTFSPDLSWFPRLAIALELTAGTMILVLLADVLDEFGLGFGNGAIVMYALGPVAGELHRLAFIFDSTPSAQVLYRPIAIWLAFSVGALVATVGVTLAARRVAQPGTKKSASKPIELRFVMSGVLRPPIFAGAVLFVPLIFANYLASTNPNASRWILSSLTPYGPNLWTDAAYVAVDACLVIGFAYFIAATDFRFTQVSRNVAAHILRLAFLGGVFLAITVVALPVLEWNASRAAGSAIPMSGFDAVLAAVMVLAIVRSLEQSTKVSDARQPVLRSRMP
jgi:preprotein translocase subunit SecY